MNIFFYPFVSLSGQQRSRMLATLFKDERCQQLATYGILEKMYLDRIIRGNQLQEFAAMLMPHQKATTADGGLNDLSGSRAALRLARRLREITGAFDVFSTVQVPASWTEL